MSSSLGRAAKVVSRVLLQIIYKMLSFKVFEAILVATHGYHICLSLMTN